MSTRSTTRRRGPSASSAPRAASNCGIRGPARTQPLAVLSQDASGTRLKLPLTEKEMQLIVFSPGRAEIARVGNSCFARSSISLDGPWEFELEPTLDNRFGDFHWPPTKTLIGAEARRLKYADETTADPGWQDPKLDDSKWATVTCGFGPRFWKLGPLPDTAEADAVLAAAATRRSRLFPSRSAESTTAGNPTSSPGVSASRTTARTRATTG